MQGVRIGISGWRYQPWRGPFYPEDLAQRRELEFASRAFTTIEINGSFYSLQTPASYERWRAETPDDFVFSVKGGRFITHMKRLLEVEKPLANFFASGVLALQENLGPILWQFPASFRFDPERFAQFFSLLPRDTESARQLASRHDSKLKTRAWLRIDRNRPVRHAVEIRHESFRDEAFVRLLRKHRIALVVTDGGPRWPLFEDVTSDFVYIRLHGAEELYSSSYGDEALDFWADRIRLWNFGEQPADARTISERLPPARKSREVFMYFDNDAKVKAPSDAKRLIARLA